MNTQKIVSLGELLDNGFDCSLGDVIPYIDEFCMEGVWRLLHSLRIDHNESPLSWSITNEFLEVEDLSYFVDLRQKHARTTLEEGSKELSESLQLLRDLNRTIQARYYGVRHVRKNKRYKVSSRHPLYELWHRIRLGVGDKITRRDQVNFEEYWELGFEYSEDYDILDHLFSYSFYGVQLRLCKPVIETLDRQKAKPSDKGVYWLGAQRYHFTDYSPKNAGNVTPLIIRDNRLEDHVSGPYNQARRFKAQPPGVFYLTRYFVHMNLLHRILRKGSCT